MKFEITVYHDKRDKNKNSFYIVNDWFSKEALRQNAHLFEEIICEAREIRRGKVDLKKLMRGEK